MHVKLKKGLAGAATLAAGATFLPLLAASPAFAATNNGGLTMTPATGTSATNFDLNFPGSSIACPGDSATGGYSVQGFTVPAGTNYDTLTFNGLGPSVGRPLSDIGGNALIFGTTEVTSGNVLQLPGTFTFGNDLPGDYAPGVYDVGIACTQGTGAGMVKSYWTNTITITTNTTTGGPAQISYVQGAVTPPAIPSAPQNVVVTPGSGQLSVAFAPPATGNPTAYTYTATATPTGGGAAVTATGTTSPIVVPGLTNGVPYNVTVSASNTTGAGPASAPVSATPAAAALVVTATPAVESLAVSWTPPAGPAPTNYLVTAAPGGFTATVTGTSTTIPSLTAGTPYTVTVTPTYAGQPNGTPGSATATPLSSGILVQNIKAARPAGVLVLTQNCGTDPTCTVDLGTGTIDPSGTYYTATGTLYELTVSDTRDVDAGWSVRGDLADTFTKVGGTGSFDSRAMGWTPSITYNAPAAPGGYDANPVAGPAIAPNTSNDIKTGIAVLFSAPAGSGLGVARATAGVTLQIPVSASSGTYTAQLAVSVS